jgi:Rod binding domain-containing protein
MVNDVTALVVKPATSLGKSVVGDDAWKAKLTDGAKQFEAMLLEQMLKPLKFGGVPGAEVGDAGDKDEDQPDAAADVVRGFGTEALAKAIAAGGGFGLARQIIRQVSAEHDSVAGKGGGTKVHGGGGRSMK